MSLVSPFSVGFISVADDAAFEVFKSTYMMRFNVEKVIYLFFGLEKRY